MNDSLLLQSDLPDVPLLFRGKVRDIYDLGDRLLLVATDRISAFDVGPADRHPGQGRGPDAALGLLVRRDPRARPEPPRHAPSVADFPAALQQFADQLSDRAMLVKKARRIDVECVVRGYIAGSAWAEYRKQGTVAGVALPAGLRESERLPEPIFTPSTKAATGHDENITVEQLRELVGADLTAEARRAQPRALRLRARARARSAASSSPTRSSSSARLGDELILIDEVADAGLVALLVGGRVRGRRGRSRASTSSTSATGSRRAAGTRSRRRPSCPAEVVAADGGEVPRGLRAPDCVISPSERPVGVQREKLGQRRSPCARQAVARACADRLRSRRP